jgi:hypothetical protein
MDQERCEVGDVFGAFTVLIDKQPSIISLVPLIQPTLQVQWPFASAT